MESGIQILENRINNAKSIFYRIYLDFVDEIAAIKFYLNNAKYSVYWSVILLLELLILNEKTAYFDLYVL